VAEHTRAALAQGYRYIKLHETEEPEVKAARETAGAGVPIMVDTNCPWTPVEARAHALRLKAYDLHWLEEPIFPPEDFRALAVLRRETGIAIAAGENACTAFEFEKMFAAGAVTFAQPSVAKVGGITEFRKVAALAEVSGVALMPHSPYFGPGFLATLHLGAAHPTPSLIERFYLELEASLYGDAIDPVRGRFHLPMGPGLGREPDPDVIKEYQVASA
jgi:D-galactarolactone cycloisomerase